MLLGQMQNQPLLTSMLLDFAARHHGDGEIVSRRVEGDIHRYTYADLARRSKQLRWRPAARSRATALRPSRGMATATWSCTSAWRAPGA